nr:MAG TPA_asm: hypothetical protein [Caudoviricetes sp.]
MQDKNTIRILIPSTRNATSKTPPQTLRERQEANRQHATG